MPNWEYKVIQTDRAENTDHVQNLFTAMGDQGWELVCTDRYFVFKRPVEGALDDYPEGYKWIQQ